MLYLLSPNHVASSDRPLSSRFLLQDRKQPDVCDKFFHDVPFEAHLASDIPELQDMTAMPGVDGFTMKVDALYKVSLYCS